MDIGIVTAENIKIVLGNASKEYYEDYKVNKIKNDKTDKTDKNDNKESNDNVDSKANIENTDKIHKVDKIDKTDSNKASNNVPMQMEIRGRDIVSGLPLKMTITSDEIREAIIETINSIVNGIKRVLERTPPELSSDIYTNGIYLSGGGALLKGLDRFIEKETGIRVFIAENPLHSVALGAGKISENL
mgnify:CR=1 FL=1